MKAAYLVLAHQNPAHLARLVRALERPWADFYVHVDGKAALEPFQKELPPAPNVTYLVDSERVPVYWGGFSQVEATLHLLRRALASDRGYDRFTLLSGADYPIRSLDAIRKAFESDDELLRVERRLSHGPEHPHNRNVRRYHALDHRWLNKKSSPSTRLQSSVDAAMARIPRPAYRLPLYQGSQWWSLTADCVRWILDFVSENPDYVRFHRASRVSDEMFFHSIVKASPFAPRIAQDFEAGRKGEDRPDSNDHGSHYADWNTPDVPHPKVLTMSDLDALDRSTALFARKFDPTESAELLDVLDAVRRGAHRPRDVGRSMAMAMAMAAAEPGPAPAAERAAPPRVRPWYVTFAKSIRSSTLFVLIGVPILLRVCVTALREKTWDRAGFVALRKRMRGGDDRAVPRVGAPNADRAGRVVHLENYVTPAERPLVAHIVGTLGAGGVQRLILGLASSAEGRRYRHGVIGLFGTTGELEGRFREAGLPIGFCGVPWPASLNVGSYRVSRWLRHSLSWTFPSRLARELQQMGADLVHTHVAHRIDLQAEGAIRHAGLPTVWTIHGQYRPEGAELARWKRATRLLAGGGAVTAVADDLARDFRERGLHHPDGVVVTRGGVDLSAFGKPGTRDPRRRADWGIPGDALVFGASGRLVTEKAYEIFVRAARRAADEGLDAHFVIAGEGTLRGDLEKEIAAAGLRDRFHLIGFVDDVPAFLRELDAYVLCSRFEGFPIALVEALAAGVPAIATPVGGVPEMVGADGAIVVPAESVEALAGAMRRMASSSVRTRLATAGPPIARRFSIDGMAEQFTTIYGRLRHRGRADQARFHQEGMRR